MKLHFGLQLEQTQKLIMTPELRQSIEILQLPSFELNNLIAQELEKNPVIELTTEIMEEHSKVDEGKGKEEIDWEQYFEDNQFSFPKDQTYSNEYDYNQENYIKDSSTLKEYLLFQMNTSSIQNKQKKIGEYIIECIDNNGYLTMSLEEISSILNKKKEDTASVLELIQSFDPPGIAARNIKECLTIQLNQSKFWNENIERIINIYLEDLADNNFKLIAEDLNLSFEKIQEIKDLIRTLEPKPGRLFPSNDDIRYIVPDASIEKIEDKYIIIINDSAAPRLQISNFYKNMLKQEKKTSLTSKYLSEKLESAVWLIKSIEQRRDTLYNVISAILDIQKDFFDKGIAAMKPLTLRQIAEKLDIHESTVSRATNGKYVQTPIGLYELKYFFSSGIENQDGEKISSKGIKNVIKEIISRENVQKPISDQDMVEILKKKDISISRRTIAKYRNEMGILSSSKRKRY